MFSAHILKQDWSGDLPRYWNNDSAFNTHFLNALSVVLPECEKFFIGVVKPYMKTSVDDRAYILEFIKQEGYHRYAHMQYNDWLSNQGLPIKQLQATTNKRWAIANKLLTNKQKLALTICIEHITVIYAAVLLENEEMLNAMHSHFKSIWIYHAVEEIEHRAVTMDIWRNHYSSDLMIKSMMPFALIGYMWYVGKHTLVFLHHDKQLLKPQTWKDMITFLFNKKTGLIRRSFLKWMDIMKPNFHPNDHDHSHLLKINKIC
jgi:uncharacterized protein